MGDGVSNKPSLKYKIFDENETAPPKNLHEAAERGILSYINRSAERTVGFDVNQRDKLNRTALHWAAEMGQVECAEALIDYGCDVKLPECNGRTAVHLAAKEGNVEMLKVLFEDKSKSQIADLVNEADTFGITPIYLAKIESGDKNNSAFEYLLECGGKFNATQGATSLLDPAPPPKK